MARPRRRSGAPDPSADEGKDSSRGARADRAPHGDHADRVVAERGDRIFVAVHLPAFQDAYGPTADLPARRELVRLAHVRSAASRRRSRRSVDALGSAMAGSPESNEHSRPMSPRKPVSSSASKIGAKSMCPAPG